FAEILQRLEAFPTCLALGVNRRYAPLLAELREALDGPVDHVSYQVTVPQIPADHWTLDPVDGGGRLIAEAEHFLDLCHLLIEREPLTVFARALGESPEDPSALCNYAITLHYPGAVANIVFGEAGSAGHPRERLTVVAKGQVFYLDDFRTLTRHGARRQKVRRLRRPDPGHREQLRQFLRAVRGEPNRLMSLHDVVRATTCLFAAQESLRTSSAVELEAFRHELRSR
ncbi:MAG: Gfo/Idh/MocA family oxidoreductase, partial [Holophagales bacterium]|nr:Gfo/Idh/MocA family oxidoreductase [Holophagales bacterium]